MSYNVGYHNEHHDFPQIPQTRLHKLREIAPEYYENMYQHTSWTWVLYKFFTDPNMGPWSRVHRLNRGGTEEGNEKYITGNCRYGAEMDISEHLGDEHSTATSGTMPSPRVMHAKNDSAMGSGMTTRQRSKSSTKHARSDSASDAYTVMNS